MRKCSDLTSKNGCDSHFQVKKDGPQAEVVKDGVKRGSHLAQSLEVTPDLLFKMLASSCLIDVAVFHYIRHKAASCFSKVLVTLGPIINWILLSNNGKLTFLKLKKN